MTRMTGPDCVVMCNLINTYIHTYIHKYSPRISLVADGPQRARLSIPPTATMPSCLWSLRIFPSLPCSRLVIFYRDASAALFTPRQPIQWLDFTYSRSHAFRYGSQNKNHDFHKDRTQTSALVGTRATIKSQYIQHEQHWKNNNLGARKLSRAVYGGCW